MACLLASRLLGCWNLEQARSPRSAALHYVWKTHTHSRLISEGVRMRKIGGSTLFADPVCIRVLAVLCSRHYDCYQCCGRALIASAYEFPVRDRGQGTITAAAQVIPPLLCQRANSVPLGENGRRLSARGGVLGSFGGC